MVEIVALHRLCTLYILGLMNNSNGTGVSCPRDVKFTYSRPSTSILTTDALVAILQPTSHRNFKLRAQGR